MRTAFRSDDSELQALLQSVYQDGEVSVAEFRALRDKADKFLEEKFIQAPAAEIPPQAVKEEDDKGRHYTEAFIDLMKKEVERPLVAKVGEENLQALLDVQKASDKLVEGLQKISLEARRKKLDPQGRALLKRSLDSRLAALLVPVAEADASTVLVDELVSLFDAAAGDLRKAVNASRAASGATGSSNLSQGERALVEDAIEYQRTYVVVGYGSAIDRL